MSVVGNGNFSERGGPKARNRLSITATASARARHEEESTIVAPVASTMAARRCVHCSSKGANAASASSFAVRCVGGPGGARPPKGARTPSMSRKMSGCSVAAGSGFWRFGFFLPMAAYGLSHHARNASTIQRGRSFNPNIISRCLLRSRFASCRFCCTPNHEVDQALLDLRTSSLSLERLSPLPRAIPCSHQVAVQRLSRRRASHRSNSRRAITNSWIKSLI